MRRLYFDVTYTRSQREPVGIVRTVRRLFEALSLVGAGPMPIGYARGEFHSVELLHGAPGGERKPALLKIATSTLGKHMAGAVSRLPVGLLQSAWAIATARAYGVSHSPIALSDGDVLLLADASWNYAAWIGARSARERGGRVVTVVYDLMPLSHPQFCPPVIVRIFKAWLPAMIGASDALICISQSTEQELRHWAAANGVALPPTGFVHLGCDLPEQSEAAVVRPQVADWMNDSVPCFAAVGSLEPKKNYPFLVGVFERLWSAGVPVRLIIAGRCTPEWEGEFARLRQHPRHGRELLTLTDASDGEVTLLYHRSRALVITSLMEGFGLPLVEARAQGCPVIASDLAAFTELADAGVSIFPRHSADALHEQLMGHIGRDRRGEVGRMQPHLWRDTARECVDLINRLLRPGEAGAAPAQGEA